MKKLVLTLFVAFGLFFSSKTYAQLDLSNVTHDGDAWSCDAMDFSYYMLPDGHTLRCAWVIHNIEDGMKVIPQLGITDYTHNVRLILTNDNDIAFYTCEGDGPDIYYTYDFDLGYSPITLMVNGAFQAYWDGTFENFRTANGYDYGILYEP